MQSSLSGSAQLFNASRDGKPSLIAWQSVWISTHLFHEDHFSWHPALTSHTVFYPHSLLPQGHKGWFLQEIFASLKAYSFFGLSLLHTERFQTMALGMWDLHRFPTALYTTSISKTLRNSSQVMGAATHQQWS